MFSEKKYTFIFRAQLSSVCVRVCVCWVSLVVFISMDHSPPGSSAHGILQARTLEWVAMPSADGLLNPRMELASFMSPALAGGFFTTSASWEAPSLSRQCSIVDLGQEDLCLLASNVQPWSNLWSYLSPSFIKCKRGNSIFFVSFTRILISSLKKFLAHLALIFIAFLINYYIKPRTNILRYILSSPIYNNEIEAKNFPRPPNKLRGKFLRLPTSAVFLITLKCMVLD